MNKVLVQTEKNKVQESLQVKNVDGFMKDKMLWGKYLDTESFKL
jgi:hypothetical protein